MLSRKTLSAEHDELRELAAALLACVAAPQPDLTTLGKARWLLTRKLLAHLAKEDALLYPRLCASPDPRVAAVATRFAAEMGSLADRYRAYVAAWPAERIADDWIAFGAATRQILQLLLRRIEGGRDNALHADRGDPVAADSGVTAPTIRPASPDDVAGVVAMLAPVIALGEAYALPRDMTSAAIADHWFAAAHQVFVAERDGVLLGSYYIQANQAGGGAHVANAGYVTAEAARGQGVARAMAEHSFDAARAAGFRAMQFNFVLASNTVAANLWQALGFATVGRVPEAFDHPRLGPVDALVMHRFL